MYIIEFYSDRYRVKKFFEKYKISYEHISLENNPEATKLVTNINRDYRSAPIIVFPESSI